MFKNIVKLGNETERRAEFEKNKAKVCRRGGGSAPILLRLERWLFLAAKQLRSEEAKRDLKEKTQRCGDAKSVSEAARQLRSEAAKCNILLSPLEGEKKFLSKFCELRNFREGYKKYKNLDRATECAMTDVGDKKGKIEMNKNNLQQKQPNNPVDSPENKHSLLPDTAFSRFTSHFSPKRKFAFTLAEVLITLGVIGVVAALTLPTLIANYKKQVIISKLNKVYSTISQAYIFAKSDNGELQDWKLENYTESDKDDEDILYYLLPYLKVLRFCGKSEKGCFPNVAYGSIGSTGFGVNIDSSKWYSNAILEDGSIISSITFRSNVKNKVIVRGFIRVDVNGNNPPNVLGIDLFNFSISPERVVPYGLVGDGNGAVSSANDFDINRGDYCAAWVIYGKTMDYIKEKKCEPYK